MGASAKHSRPLTRSTARPKTARLRSRIAGIVCLTSVLVTTGAPAARATNTWPGAYRKWPWRNAVSTRLTTLPGQCPHCPGVQSSSAWKAIDASMYYDTVYSIGPGAVDAAVASGGAAGQYLRVKDLDGSYVTYEHLSDFVVTGGSVVAGQPIAVSGASGNVTGPHLHFQRHDAPSFSSNALDLTPISGRGGSGDALSAATAYVGDNAGVAFNATGTASVSMRDTNKALGGYSGVGVTADVNDAWTPCHTDGVPSNAWRYSCAPRSGVGGAVQTFRHGSSNRERALMHRSGTSTTFLLHRGILGAYTRAYNGHDWAYWLGFPISNRYLLSARNIYQQDFQYGYILYAPGSCLATVYLNGSNKQQTTDCD